MRSAVLSFTLLTAVAVTPAMAQQSYGTQPADTASAGGATMGEVPAPPSRQPMSHHATNLNEQTARSRISPSLPAPPVGANADATAYLQAAQTALSQNRTGEAQAALENAETYLLNRSVPQGAVNQPDQNPAVRNITEALQALGSGNRTRSMELIQQTIPLAQQHEAMIQSRGPGMSGGAQGGMQPGTTGYQASPNDYRTGMNAGAYQPGPATAGSYQPGPATAGSYQPGPATAGSYQPGPATAGSYQPGMTGYQGGNQPSATGAPPPATYGAPPPR